MYDGYFSFTDIKQKVLRRYKVTTPFSQVSDFVRRYINLLLVFLRIP